MQKGKLSRKCRLIRIKNVLTQQEHTLEVPSEELLSEIRTRYLPINAHSFAYIWRAFLPVETRDGSTSLELKELDMNKTLEENGVEDAADELNECMLGADFYVPALQLYWSDDLSIA